MMKKFVCHTKDLKDHQSYGFQIPLAEDIELDIVVLRQGKNIRAFLNHCPHLGIPLNWQPDKFLSLEETHIQCSTHGALFTLEEGYCISGPCRGQSLTALQTEIDEQGDLYLVSEQ